MKTTENCCWVGVLWAPFWHRVHTFFYLWYLVSVGTVQSLLSAVCYILCCCPSFCLTANCVCSADWLCWWELQMVVSKKFSKTNYATPRKENGRLAAWWLVDLIEHTLVCNYYTIRHDGSYDFMQNWTFQVGGFCSQQYLSWLLHW